MQMLVEAFNIANIPPNPSNVNYLEPAYFSLGGNVTAGGAPLNPGTINSLTTYNIQFPLRYIKNTAFSIDKNLYFGQTTYLKVYFGPTSKIGYFGTSANSPSEGVKTTMTGAASIANFQLMLAVETNQDIRTMTINKVVKRI